MKINVFTKQTLADLHTPVSIYLKLREKFPECLLLESSDYSGNQNAQSIICFEPLSTIEVKNNKYMVINELNNDIEKGEVNSAVEIVQQFCDRFEVDNEDVVNGVFGYTAFNAVRYFEKNLYEEDQENDFPDIKYSFYRYLIVLDHFKETMTFIENCPEGKEASLDRIHTIVTKQDVVTFPFKTEGGERSNMTDADFKSMVTKCKAHCQRGDVFQVVPSRSFQQSFKGDEFAVYRQLRSINPSPYLYYFDYVDYKIFGSSPEAQIKVVDGIAEIHPIAGTVRRTGDVQEDAALSKQLSADPKENSEHIMLVDLARNDLSKHCADVNVAKFKEIQYFSHVIHLTSVVKGNLNPSVSPYQILADTFPAGTLSGAPKHRAIEIIESLEPNYRGYYGGGIGMIGLNGDLNHAIMIRSFYSHQGSLTYQSGAGIVIHSTEEGELAEINHKLRALNTAIKSAR